MWAPPWVLSSGSRDGAGGQGGGPARGMGCPPVLAASQCQAPWLFPCVAPLPSSSLPRTQPRWFLLCLGAGDPEAEPQDLGMGEILTALQGVWKSPGVTSKEASIGGEKNAGV